MDNMDNNAVREKKHTWNLIWSSTFYILKAHACFFTGLPWERFPSLHGIKMSDCFGIFLE